MKCFFGSVVPATLQPLSERGRGGRERGKGGRDKVRGRGGGREGVL